LLGVEISELSTSRLSYKSKHNTHQNLPYPILTKPAWFISTIITKPNYGAPQNFSNAWEELQTSKMNYVEEMKELKAKHKREFDALRLLWDNDREELRSIAEEVTELQKQNEHLTNEIDVLRQNQTVTGSGNVDDTCKRNPLFMKGVETRLRLWELNKMALYNFKRDDLDQVAIETGNIAAHHQDLEADIALFKYGYLSEETEGATFEKIYEVSFNDSKFYQSQLWFKTFCALIDSSATFAMSITTHSQTQQTTEYQQCYDLHRSINGRYTQNAEIDAEEIFKLQKLVIKLVDMERKKNRHR
jgi:hypothetical protein